MMRRRERERANSQDREDLTKEKGEEVKKSDNQKIMNVKMT